MTQNGNYNWIDHSQDIFYNTQHSENGTKPINSWQGSAKPLRKVPDFSKIAQQFDLSGLLKQETCLQKDLIRYFLHKLIKLLVDMD